ncbi:MAG TPA: hypothetical protein VGF40_03010 [Thermoanaerobaculia bacterium]
MCYLGNVAKMIQVRNVPDRLHRELVRRAARRGVTLTEYIEQILEREVARPLAEELFERIASREPVDIGRPVAELIREERARAGRS